MKTIRLSRWVAVVWLVAAFCATFAVRAQNAADGFNPDVDGRVWAVLQQPDGNIVIGGNFTAVSGIARTNLARLHVDGSLDTDFDPGTFNPGLDNSRLCLAIQADGKILVGGEFTTLGGQARTNLGRLNIDGSLDMAFNPGAGGVVPTVQALAVQADGKIVVGGTFTELNGQTRNSLGRLNANGSLDMAFNPGAGAGVQVPAVDALAVQSDGKILVGGNFATLGGQTRNRIGRLNANGSLDTAFNPGASVFASARVRSLEVQVDGKILVGGLFTTLGGQFRTNLGRLNANGSVDTTFNAAVEGGTGLGVYTLALQTDGKILVGGDFTTLDGQARARFGRLNPDGSADIDFDPAGAAGGTLPAVLSLAVQSDGKIIVAGTFSFLGGTPRNAIGRITPDRAYDFDFGTQVSGSANCIASLPDAMIWVGGGFITYGGSRRTNVFGYNPNNGVITPASTTADGPVTCLAIQEDGKVLVGGQFTELNGQTRNCLGRLNANGSLDMAFNPGAGGVQIPIVRALAVQSDGRILVGGEFTTLGGQLRTNLARLNINGTVDNTFNPGANPGIDRPVECLAVQADGKILAGTRFFAPTPGARIRFGRLNANGGLDAAFNPQVFGDVWSIAIQPDEKILVGGVFSSIGGIQRTNIGRLHPNGSLDTSFNAVAMDPAGNNYVNCLALQVDGRIVVGGRFTTLGGQPRNRIGRLYSDGILDASFDPDLGGSAFAYVHSLAVQEDGRILMGGNFTTLGGLPRTNLARLTGGYAASQSLTFEGTENVVWNRSGAGPEFSRVTFEGSFDGINYLSLSEGTYTNGAWRGENARLGQGQIFYVRARGRAFGGNGNGSSSIIESTRQFFLPGNAPVLSASVPAGAGPFQVSFPYTSGITFDVLATTDVNQLPARWTMLGPAVEFAPRQYQFIDPEAANLPRRFYQVRAP